MKGFFSVEGAFFTVTGKICDMVVITVLWAVGCIPVVTFFTSTASMYHTTVKCIRYDRGKVFEEFKDAYKKNLKQGIPLGILYGAAGGCDRSRGSLCPGAGCFRDRSGCVPGGGHAACQLPVRGEPDLDDPGIFEIF